MIDIDHKSKRISQTSGCSISIVRPTENRTNRRPYDIFARTQIESNPSGFPGTLTLSPLVGRDDRRRVAAGSNRRDPTPGGGGDR